MREAKGERRMVCEKDGRTRARPQERDSLQGTRYKDTRVRASLRRGSFLLFFSSLSVPLTPLRLYLLCVKEKKKREKGGEKKEKKTL
jgi:hypothetical protein